MPAAPVEHYSRSVDHQLRRRRSLLEIALTGGRRTWHVTVRIIMVGLAALTALLIATEQHRVCESIGRCDADEWSASHSLASDLGAAPWLLLGFLIVLQLIAYRGKLLPSIFTALGSAVIALMVTVTTGLVHFLSNVDGGGGATAASLMMLMLALFQLVLEPVLAAGQRKQLEASEPVFPRAAVVSI